MNILKTILNILQRKNAFTDDGYSEWIARKDEPCGYCGTVDDPNVICKDCYESMN